MRRRLGLLSIALVCLGLTSPPAGAGTIACDRTTGIEGSAFDPSVTTIVSQDDMHACWHNSDPFAHTATADSGIFDAGTLAADADADVQLFGAGAYAYHCAIHPSMHGTFNVRPGVSDGAIVVGESFELRIGDHATFVPAPTWDVQRRRNDGAWVTIRRGTSLASFDVAPARTGTFRFRARTHLSGDVAGWSPARIVRVTAA